MNRWQRTAETAAIIAAVALCVIVAGPGGALEHMIVPLLGAGAAPTQRLTELAFGIPLAVMLVPGLAFWAWGSSLRPSGTALTVLGSLAVSVDLIVKARLTTAAWVLLSALWLLAVYQTATVGHLRRSRRRPAALPLAAAAGALPWVLHAGGLLLPLLRDGVTVDPDHLVVTTLALATCALILLPVLRMRPFAPAGTVASVGAVIYALMSLRWSEPVIALSPVLAVCAVATAIAYVDTLWRLSPSRRRRTRSGDGRYDAADRR